MDEIKFDFNEDIQFKILQLVLQDYDWARSVGLEIIEARFFNNIMFGKIFDWAKYIMEKYNVPAPKTTLKDCATKVYNDNKITLSEKTAYDELIEKCFEQLDAEVDGIDYIKDRALDFAKKEKV